MSNMVSAVNAQDVRDILIREMTQCFEAFIENLRALNDLMDIEIPTIHKIKLHIISSK